MQELIQQLFTSQGNPSPDLLRKIRAHGQEIIPTLIQVLNQQEEKNLEFVILLLGSFNARQVIPALQDLLRNRKFATNIHSAIATALYEMQALEELLTAVQDDQMTVIARSECLWASAYLAEKSQQNHTRVCQTLHGQLEQFLQRAPTITKDEILFGEHLITAMIALGYHEADNILEKAFLSSGIEEWFILHDEVMQVHPTIVLPPDWLDRYEEEYQRKSWTLRKP
ncbi:hypothetical protein MASR2M66_29480 [Chloroflexota bacterium]